MEIKSNIALAPYTTFKIGGPAKFFCSAETPDDLKTALDFAQQQQVPVFILGGGSNVLISDEGYPGLVINLQNKGREVRGESADFVTITIASGEVWDDVVEYAVSKNLWGIENLSHIPGLMGGFAVQNVGAYGQEASQVVENVQTFDLVAREVVNFNNTDCQFSYRHSLFNTGGKGRYAILSTTLRLSKRPQPNLKYGALKKYFAERNTTNPTLQQIRQAIIEIRNTVFPFPKEAKNGNAGSFFRGHLLSAQQKHALFAKVQENFGLEAVAKLEAMADRLTVPQGMKTPTAFLIELCGLKGYQLKGAQVCPTHAALILNATGSATAKDVIELFRYVRSIVQDKTGVSLHVEPELVGFAEDILDDF
jgi:UDP-N-acetylmuramate dehydrogenase